MKRLLEEALTEPAHVVTGEPCWCGSRKGRLLDGERIRVHYSLARILREHPGLDEVIFVARMQP